LTAAVYMNRTRALIPLGGSVRRGWLELTIGSTRIQVPVPDGPHYSLDIAITSPMFRLTSDGKQPDCAPFADALSEAIGKAAKAAGREIAALMTAQEKEVSARCQQQQHDTEYQQRLADREAKERRKVEVERLKAERRAMPTIHDVVLELLPDAVAIESESSLPFNTRRLVYRIRDRVLADRQGTDAGVFRRPADGNRGGARRSITAAVSRGARQFPDPASILQGNAARDRNRSRVPAPSLDIQQGASDREG
jgi:hypothetical protein